MKKTNKHLLLLIFIAIFNSYNAFAQNKRTKAIADKQYEGLAYVDASENYLKIIKSGFRSPEILLKLGNAYYFNSKYKEAAKWYKELYAEKKVDDKKYLLRYSQSLRSLGDEKKAEEIYIEFLKSVNTSGNDPQNTKVFHDILDKDSSRFAINPLEINSKYIDYGAFLKNDTLYFSSSRYNHRSAIKRIDSWNNDRFLDIYFSVFNPKKESFTKPKRLKGSINSKYHESSAVITKDGRVMYFTASDRSFSSSKKRITNVKIYKATRVKGKWTKIEELSINGNNYSTAHPMLSPNEKRLYFASNMPSSLGETDIYFVDLNEQGGIVGKPKNLGPKINTKGNEAFPFVSEENELYFSSNGHYGFGGYDIYYVDLKTEDKYLINLGNPINSYKNDYALSIDVNTRKGFFSSNRGSNDNIYSLEQTGKPINTLLKMEINGIVIDYDTAEPIKNALVTLEEVKNKNLVTLETDERGTFSKVVDKYKSFIVGASKDHYESGENIEVAKMQNSVYLTFKLKKIEPITLKPINEVEKGINLSDSLKIDKFYFNYNSSFLTQRAKKSLFKLIQYLNDNPKINIEIVSHADSRGTDKYNNWLSQRRAKTTKEYLISKGIDEGRLTTKFLGERELTNKCKNNVSCTKEEHRSNRRTVFLVK